MLRIGLPKWLGSEGLLRTCECVLRNQRTHHLPNLHDVVLRHRADHPGLVGVPGEVGDLGRVTSVDELQDRQKGS